MKREPIYFTTKQGRRMVLMPEKAEYRAYELVSANDRKDLRLGSILPDPLIQYIKERM